ncbi:hypothetical protein EDB86DRAFT_2943661 [Lactarius hatsudake]|nr:hypothetical protein EDB86DRAFT_2943661 [Lactarius hatsudake]
MEDALTSRNYRTETANGSRPELRVCAYRQATQHRAHTHARRPRLRAVRLPLRPRDPRRHHWRACILEATSQASSGSSPLDGAENGGVYRHSTPSSSPLSISAVATSARAAGPVHLQPMVKAPALWFGRGGGNGPRRNVYRARGALLLLTRSGRRCTCSSVSLCTGTRGVWGKETHLEHFGTCLDWVAVRDAYARYAFRSASRRALQ